MQKANSEQTASEIFCEPYFHTPTAEERKRLNMEDKFFDGFLIVTAECFAPKRKPRAATKK